MKKWLKSSFNYHQIRSLSVLLSELKRNLQVNPCGLNNFLLCVLSSFLVASWYVIEFDTIFSKENTIIDSVYIIIVDKNKKPKGQRSLI